jgi:hypothetical protein
MKNNKDNNSSLKKIQVKDIFTLFLVVIIIVLVYFSMNNRHKENLDLIAKSNETCRELSLISKGIAKSNETGFENILPENISEQTLLADRYFRDLFSKKIAYQQLLDDFEYPYFQDKAGFGLLLPNKTVVWFKHLSNECDDKKPCAAIYIDVNNKEKPNKEDEDRTIQKIYKDGIKCEIKYVEI